MAVGLVDGAGGDYEAGLAGGLVVERDVAEGLLVLGDVLREDVGEGFGLLRAEVNALGVVNGEVLAGLLLEGAEDEHEVPDGEADLDGVGVGVAVVGGFVEGDGGVVGIRDGFGHGVLVGVGAEEGT